MICRKATVALLDANPFIFEHINDIFVRFCPSGPLFSGISSTKSRFLCFFGLRDPRFRAFRAQNRGFCARLLNWMSGLGHFPADRGIVAPAQPILPLTLPPLHLLSRCTCGAVASAQPILLQPTLVAPDGACGLGYHSGLGGGVEDIVD